MMASSLASGFSAVLLAVVDLRPGPMPTHHLRAAAHLLGELLHSEDKISAREEMQPW